MRKVGKIWLMYFIQAGDRGWGKGEVLALQYFKVDET